MGFIFLSSFTQLQELKDKNRKIDAMIEKLKQENAILEQQIQYLKKEPVYQEGILREKMGVVRKGEVPVKIIPEE
ncbi:MAG: septum formation initiator family protein [Candidatus Omnitrophica bacterium]|nr:septum formation initiator family protein [Candidatus Omnitrophota bacterium]